MGLLKGGCPECIKFSALESHLIDAHGLKFRPCSNIDEVLISSTETFLHPVLSETQHISGFQCLDRSFVFIWSRQWLYEKGLVDDTFQAAGEEIRLWCIVLDDKLIASRAVARVVITTSVECKCGDDKKKTSIEFPLQIQRYNHYANLHSTSVPSKSVYLNIRMNSLSHEPF